MPRSIEAQDYQTRMQIDIARQKRARTPEQRRAKRRDAAKNILTILGIAGALYGGEKGVKAAYHEIKGATAIEQPATATQGVPESHVSHQAILPDRQDVLEKMPSTHRQ